MLKVFWNAVLSLFGLDNRSSSQENTYNSSQRLPFRTSVPQTSVARPSQTSTPHPEPSPPPTPSPPKLYEGKAFTFEHAHLQGAKELLFFTEKGQHRGPTPKQLEVIFSEEAATTVSAGAGSGKSTTLVSRILFLHKFCGVPFSNMAVFTFTRKSRADFIEKLVREAKRWGVRLNETGARRIVRTFHSKALQLSRGLLAADESPFEFLGNKPDSTAKQIADDDSPEQEKLSAAEQEANEIEGYIDLEASHEQAQILKDAYTNCYNNDEKFRLSISALFEYTLTTDGLEQDEKYNEKLVHIRSMAQRDEALCNHLEEKWAQQGCWPISGVETTTQEGKRYQLEVLGHSFMANGYIPNLGIYVVLGAYDGISEKSIKPNLEQKIELKPKYNVYDKRHVLLAGCPQKIRYINNSKDAESLKRQLQLLSLKEALSAPAVEVRLPGEYKAKPIFTALYTFGVFAENLGLQPEKLSTQLNNLSPIESHAAYAVSAFFKQFNVELKRLRLVTFNQIFARLGVGSKDLAQVDLGALMGVKHLMIDEFQDISPLIVNFVVGLHTELREKTKGSQKLSLMCVGDDWQSIYGWRGSSPHFFLNLPHYFKGACPNPIKLQQNFRSSQRIVDCGEAFIKLVKHKSDKRGIASSPSVKDLPYPVVSISEYQDRDVVNTISEILGRMQDDEEIYLLAATKEDLKRFSYLQDRRLTKTTFHQSKGLEADYVVLLGATKYFGKNSLKNSLYALAKFPYTFDMAQQDEALRVAYVAATRAKKLCVWFAKAFSQNVMEQVSADGSARVDMDASEVKAHITRCFSAMANL